MSTYSLTVTLIRELGDDAAVIGTATPSSAQLLELVRSELQAAYTAGYIGGRFIVRDKIETPAD